MASFTQPTNNQTTLPPPQGASEASPTIESRTIPTPERKQARRKGQHGKVGSQRTSRYVFNAAYWRAAGVVGQGDKPENPITKATTLSILQRAREILHKHLKVPRGELTHTEMKMKHDLQLARRYLERCFPVLGLAENQWAASYFLQEVTRRDKKKGCGRSRSLGEGDEGERETPRSSQCSVHGRVEDGGETGVFGEGLESQEASAGIFPGLINGTDENQPRHRIAPTTARSR